MTTERRLAPLYWGLGLFITGFLFTLFALGPLAVYSQEITWVVMGILGVAGLATLIYTVLRPERWWYFIPACVLLSMAGVVYLSARPQVESSLLSVLLLAGLGLAHLFIFLTNRQERWWAWISAGGFFVLALAVSVAASLPASLVGALLFAGMSAVFFLLYFLSAPPRRRWWVAALATVLLVGAAFIVTLAAPVQASPFRYWPLALILIGAGLIAWTIVRLLTPQVSPRPASPTEVAAGAGDMPSVTPVPEEFPDRPATSPEFSTPVEHKSTEEPEGSQ